LQWSTGGSEMAAKVTKKSSSKAKLGTKPKLASKSSKTLKQGTIRVRMYRIGFGDCFLVSLPVSPGSNSKETHHHILFDCGVHSKGDIGTMKQAVDDIAEVTGKKLAVVVASHAHQDHIAGFDKFAEVFSTFDIGEVWLPWTWNPNNQTAV